MVVSHDCVQVEQYFYTRLLGLDTAVPGSWAAVRGELAACLAVLWVWAYFCTWKRRRTTQLSRQELATDLREVSHCLKKASSL